MAFGWTDEQSDLALRLWQDGQSGSEIAVNPGIRRTRNAVIAHIHRLRLKGGVAVRSARPSSQGLRSKAPAKKRTNKRLSKPKTIPIPKPDYWSAPTITIVVPEDQRRQLLGPNYSSEGGVLDTQCRYISGDPREPDWHYCHQTKAPGLSYCVDHIRLVYVPPETVRRAYVPGVPAPVKESVDA